ncbi:MAG: serine/threonine protein kinase [Cyanobacteria bacterium]|nr:serine/threonine protein kinase [Cyanobacteriota bacterium]
MFNRFRIIELIGDGGMGVVYKAENIALMRVVALKLLPSEVVSKRSTLRLQKEAKTLSLLDHPNLAKIYDFGLGDGRVPYLSMEFVEGPSLDQMLDQGTLDLKTFLDLFTQIGEGLAHVHSRNVVHRDLKPGNIILSSDDKSNLRAVLVDFGIAYVEDEDTLSRLTATGVFVGSPLYTNPEQIRGRKVGPASDIYSLSCVMFHALTGYPPFSGRTILQTVSMHLDDKITPDWGTNNGGIPHELIEIVGQGLSKDPLDRPQTAEELVLPLKQLSAILSTETQTDFSTVIRVSLPVKNFTKEQAAIVLALLSLLVVLCVPWSRRVYDKPYPVNFDDKNLLPSNLDKEAQKKANEIEKKSSKHAIANYLWKTADHLFKEASTDADFLQVADNYRKAIAEFKKHPELSKEKS